MCLHFRLHKETLYLAVYFIDRYMSLRSSVHKDSLQLLGVSALFAAAKLEEIYPPSLREFSDVCDGQCPARLIADTEIDVLMALRWHLNVATPYFWLSCYVALMEPRVGQRTAEDVRRGALQILDVAMHTPLWTRISYSLLAAAALYIKYPDSDMVHWATGMDVAQVHRAMSLLLTFSRHRIEYPPPKEAVRSTDFELVIKKNALVLQWLLDEIKAGRVN